VNQAGRPNGADQKEWCLKPADNPVRNPRPEPKRSGWRNQGGENEMKLSLRDCIEDLVLDIMERNDITEKQAREILSEILSNSTVQEEIHKDAKAWVRAKRGAGEWR
jgi:hypothetical protein